MIDTVRLTKVFTALIVAVLISFVLPLSATADEQAIYTLQADGLACPFCAYGIEKQLNRIEGVESVSTDIKNGIVIVTMRPSSTLAEVDAKDAVEAAGFTMREFKKEDIDT